MTKQSIPVRLASLAMILGSLFSVTPPLAMAADDVGAGPDTPVGVSEFWVDRSDDSNHVSASMCTSANPNDCSLRGAINRVNTDVVVNATIRFSSTVSQINLASALPSLTTTGTNVKGVNGPRVSGAALASGAMMTIDTSQAVIEGLRFINGDTLDISVVSGSGNVIRQNTIGAPDGSVSNCNSAGVTRNSNVGIKVGPAVTGNSAAPSVWIYDNNINCHNFGIQVDGADGVVIGVNHETTAAARNYIGTNPSQNTVPNGVGIVLNSNDSNGAKNNQIRNNWIWNSGTEGVWLSGTGTNNANSTTGNAITGNDIRGSGRMASASAIRLNAGAFWNAIGGTDATDANKIYDNTGDGIRIESSDLNGILGNLIGGSPGHSGNNTGHGVSIDNGKDNWIGGLFLLIGSSQAGNEIGGNDGDGIRLTNVARNTTIRRNLIGSDPYGTPRPNGGSGISILSGSYSTTIGTGNAVDLNVIAGNAIHGVRIDGANTTSNTIRYNDIGLNTNSAQKCASPPCVAIVPNGSFGLVVQNGAHHNRAYDGNYIAHNGFGGVWVLSGARDNQFGPGDAVFANTGSGILFSDAQWNRMTVMEIYSNTRDGIEQTSAGSNNSWISTTTYLNGGLGIDIATTTDDNIPTAGFPVITSVVRAGGVVTVTGTSDTSFSGLTYRTTTVYLFHGGLDPSGYGEGQTLAGSANTNASGVWRVVYNDASTSRCYAAYKRVVAFDGATFTDASSEFSLSTCTPKKAYVPRVVR